MLDIHVEPAAALRTVIQMQLIKRNKAGAGKAIYYGAANFWLHIFVRHDIGVQHDDIRQGGARGIAVYIQMDGGGVEIQATRILVEVNNAAAGGVGFFGAANQIIPAGTAERRIIDLILVIKNHKAGDRLGGVHGQGIAHVDALAALRALVQVNVNHDVAGIDELLLGFLGRIRRHKADGGDVAPEFLCDGRAEQACQQHAQHQQRGQQPGEVECFLHGHSSCVMIRVDCAVLRGRRDLCPDGRAR